MRSAVGFVDHLDGVACVGDLLHQRARRRGDAALAERSSDLRRDVFIFERGQPRQRLDHGDLRSERSIQGRELQPDGARADHDGRGGDVVVPQRLVTGDDPGRDLQPGEHLRTRPAGDHNGGGLEPAVADVHRRTRTDPGASRDDLDPSMLDKPGEPLHQLVDHRVLECDDRRPVGLARGLDPPFGRALDRIHHRSRLQQCLRRDAPAEQAGSSEPLVLLHDGDPLAQLRGTQGGGIAAGASSDYDDVERVAHAESQSTRVPQPDQATCSVARAYDAADGGHG